MITALVILIGVGIVYLVHRTNLALITEAYLRDVEQEEEK